jgi:hypothetical protein
LSALQAATQDIIVIRGSGFAQFGQGGILRAATGLITQGPVVLGESPNATRWGKGTEAAIPLDSRGIGILGQAMKIALGDSGAGKGQRPIVIDLRGAYVPDRSGFVRDIEHALDKIVRRQTGV